MIGLQNSPRAHREGGHMYDLPLTYGLWGCLPHPPWALGLLQSYHSNNQKPMFFVYFVYKKH